MTKHYFLFFILFLAVFFFFFFRYQPQFQRWVIYFSSAGYFFWSLLYHYRQGDLELSVIIEYLLFALFAVVLISFTLI